MSIHPNNPSRIWEHWKHRERFRLNALLAIPQSRRTFTEMARIRKLEKRLGVGLVTCPEGPGKSWGKKWEQ